LSDVNLFLKIVKKKPLGILNYFNNKLNFNLNELLTIVFQFQVYRHYHIGVFIVIIIIFCSALLLKHSSICILIFRLISFLYSMRIISNYSETLIFDCSFVLISLSYATHFLSGDRDKFAYVIDISLF